MRPLASQFSISCLISPAHSLPVPGPYPTDPSSQHMLSHYPSLSHPLPIQDKCIAASINNANCSLHSMHTHRCVQSLCSLTILMQYVPRLPPGGRGEAVVLVGTVGDCVGAESSGISPAPLPLNGASSECTAAAAVQCTKDCSIRTIVNMRLKPRHLHPHPSCVDIAVCAHHLDLTLVMETWG